MMKREMYAKKKPRANRRLASADDVVGCGRMRMSADETDVVVDVVVVVVVLGRRKNVAKSMKRRPSTSSRVIGGSMDSMADGSTGFPGFQWVLSWVVLDL